VNAELKSIPERVLFVLVLAALLLAGCQPSRDVAERVEILADWEHPGPGMTFELRFSEPIATPGQVGIPLTNSPLVINPPVPGTFTWLSQRNGRFVPSRALAMDTRYELRLAAGLSNAAGQEVTARLHKTLRTPPFAVANFLPLRLNTNSTSEPEVMLVFNAAVESANANRFMEFRSSTGLRVAAHVRQGTVEELSEDYEFGSGVSLRTWNEQYAYSLSMADRARFQEPEVRGTNTVPNFLIVSPGQPLPIGKGWRLEIGSGLPAAEGGWRLKSRQVVEIGDVTPFTFLGGFTKNIIGHEPSITLQFSKALAPSLTNDWAKWITIEPAPAKLAMQLRETEAIFRGSFTSGTICTVTIRPGLPAAESFSLAETQVLTASIDRVAPRLYFPAFSGDQLAGGNRTFPLLAVNVPGVRLRAKVLDPQTAVYALEGYDGYSRPWQERESWDEPFRRIDYNLVPGRTVFDKGIPISALVDAPTNMSLSWDTILSGRKTAVVFLEAERIRENPDNEPRLGTQSLIQLTDLGLLWKNTASGVEAFVFSHGTGKPVAGATVKLLGGDNEPLGQATTTAEGLAQMPANTNAQWLAVQLADDFHALQIEDHRIPLYAFHLPTTDFENAQDSRRVLLFGDREFYRPGETVQLAALVRDWTEHGLSIPTGLSGTLVCKDARNRKFFETNVNFSAFGSCAVAVPLSAEVRGLYQAVLRLGQQDYTHVFHVEDFRPSAFEISAPTRPDYGPGEKITVPVSARYFFGKPVTHAQVRWSIDAADTEYTPKDFTGFAFNQAWIENRFSRGPSVLSLTGQGKLAGATNLVIAPELPLNPAAPRPRAASLEVEVTDINQQTLTRRSEFLLHSSEFYLGLKRLDDVQEAGKELPLEIVAVGRDGKPWQQAVTARVTLEKVEWQPVRLQGAGRSVRFHNQAVFTNIAERVVQVAPAGPGNTAKGVSGTPLAGLAAPEAGQYLLKASATDPEGRPVASSIEFTVSAPGHLGWDYANDFQITLKPDRQTYTPGDTAKILVETPISGTALVTVERDGVLRSFTTELSGNAPMVSVPIEPGDVPNLYVSVALVRGSDACPRQVKEPDYRIGYCQLAVEDPQRRLAIEVQTGATNYLPAQPVTAAIEIKDSQGRPANDAEVIVYAVDEGVLSLSSAEMPDPYGFFYTSRLLGVHTSISLPNLLREDPTELRFGNKGYLGGGGGDEPLRKNFLACAFWKTDLRTDSNGRVQVQFPAPDGLTSYRLVAVAHTRANQFGSSQASFKVSKPLVVEPALPLFANVTDRLQARAIVLNQTDRAGEVEVTLELDGRAKAVPGSPSLNRKVQIAAKSSAAVEFPVEFVEDGVAKWIWKARFANEGGFADAVQSTLKVGFPAPELREVFFAKAQGTELDLLSRANPEILAGKGTVTVRLANSRLVSLSEAIPDLLHYPYGCAEQTSSSLLPWIVLQGQDQWRQALFSGVNDPQKAIRSGVARLFSMQTQSGGLGYWPRDREPMFWASAYGGLVLALAQRHGIELPKDEFERLLGYLSSHLRSDGPQAIPEEDLCLAAYALALADHAEPAYYEKLFNQRELLSSESRALLALGVMESQGPQAMVDELLGGKPGSKRANENPFGCAAREKAIRLLANVCARPDATETDALVAELLEEQQAGQWATTQGNAWAVLALSEYGRRIEKNLEPCDGELLWGQERIPFHLEGTNNVFTRAFSLSPGTNPPALKLACSKGTVFAGTTLAARPQAISQPRQDMGFGLRRRYQRLTDENKPEDVKGLRVGDRVLVTLGLEVREPARFVAIDDALPSNLEAINPEFKDQQTHLGNQADGPELEEGFDWICDFREIRAERVLFFANELRPGNYIIRYVARVRASATATAASAKVEEMYHPSHYGLTEAQVLSTQPMD